MRKERVVKEQEGEGVNNDDVFALFACCSSTNGFRFVLPFIVVYSWISFRTKLDQYVSNFCVR